MAGSFVCFFYFVFFFQDFVFFFHLVILAITYSTSCSRLTTFTYCTVLWRSSIGNLGCSFLIWNTNASPSPSPLHGGDCFVVHWRLLGRLITVWVICLVNWFILVKNVLVLKMNTTAATTSLHWKLKSLSHFCSWIYNFCPIPVRWGHYKSKCNTKFHYSC